MEGSDVSSGTYIAPPPESFRTFFGQRTNTSYRLAGGLVLSGGVDLNLGHVRISPEFRYLHWRDPFLQQVGGDGSDFIQSNDNEYFVLVGISWRLNRDRHK